MPTLRNIALPYRIFFLYIEPVLALGGTYLSHFDPAGFLVGTVPLPALIAAGPAATDISPLTQLLLTNIAALYFLFAVNEAVVLRCTRERGVWLAVLGGMLVSDVGHLYAVWAIAPERALQIANWSFEERVNYGTLVFGALMRLAFLLGIGNS